jgi:(S)-3,5-dihydroxyphenylglycine transaminase
VTSEPRLARPPSAPDPDAGLRLRACFASPLLGAMDFLNEVVLDHPDAISFAPGRPHESQLRVADVAPGIDRFVSHLAGLRGVPAAAVRDELGQYQRTNGIVNDVVASQLRNDEGIDVAPDAVMITNGAQEAMLVALMGAFDPASDVLLCSDPTYIGITAPAAILGIEVVGVPSGPDGLETAAVEAAIRQVHDRGRVPRALYDVPDFNNPLGTTMPLAARRRLIEVAHGAGMLLLEDNPYGMFAYDGPRLPALKALDATRTVVYIGSYAKTVLPGLRVGFLVADQPCAPGGRPLAAELSRVKSVTTVNTSPIAQAALAGILLEHGCSLTRYVQPRVDFCRRNRDHLLARLEQELGATAVTWNRPRGGFFVTLTLPFDFDDECFRTCAADFGVVVCPMSLFSIASARANQVRLAFSYVDGAEIDAGVERLARFVHRRTG